jgi:hypothetical protein
MPSASDLQMIDLDDTVNPVTCRFNLATSWGISSQELTFEIPELTDKIPETFAWFNGLWAGYIARTMNHNCMLSFLEIVRWKSFAFPLVGASGAPAGRRPGPGTARNASGVVMMHTGHQDRYARRKLFLPNLPVAWQNNRVLNGVGISAIYDMCAEIWMGAHEPELETPTMWLLPYPRVLAASPSNVAGVAFRRVHSLRICTYCDNAPDEVPLEWP